MGARHGRVLSLRRACTRVFAALLAMMTFLQQATSAPSEIFTSAAPVVGSDAPKARDIKDGDASIATQTGSLNYSYTIHVPPGRNGMAPQLALSYASQAPIYGTIAAGWSLSIPEIREDTSQGRLATRSSFYESQQPDPKADDRFVSSLAGGRPLIKVTERFDETTAYGAYRAQNDSSFARYERMLPGQPYRWRVRATDGSVLYFGDTSLTSGCNNISEGYAPLTRAVDMYGNEVVYEYESAVTHECRIKKITWGQNANAFITQPFAKVEFTWQISPRCFDIDVGQVGSQLDYRSGTKIVTGASKLLSIRATAFPASDRQWQCDL